MGETIAYLGLAMVWLGEEHREAPQDFFAQAFIFWVPTLCKPLGLFHHTLRPPETHKLLERACLFLALSRNGNPLQCSCLENPRDRAPACCCRVSCMMAERREPPPQQAIPESLGLWWLPWHNRICHSELANSPFFVYRPDGHYQSQRAGQKAWPSHPALSRDLIAVSCCSEVLCSSDFIIITKHALELHPK